MKTNKSYTKRLKVRKNGKIQHKTPAANHFNSKQRSAKRDRVRRSKWNEFKMTAKSIAQFLPGTKTGK